MLTCVGLNESASFRPEHYWWRRWCVVTRCMNLSLMNSLPAGTCCMFSQRVSAPSQRPTCLWDVHPATCEAQEPRAGGRVQPVSLYERRLIDQKEERKGQIGGTERERKAASLFYQWTLLQYKGRPLLNILLCSLFCSAHSSQSKQMFYLCFPCCAIPSIPSVVHWPPTVFYRPLSSHQAMARQLKYASPAGWPQTRSSKNYYTSSRWLSSHFA